MRVDDHGKVAGCAGRADDPDVDVAGRTARHLHPRLVDLRLGDFARLHVVEDLASLDRAQLGQERRVGGRLGERLRSGLEDGCPDCDFGHDRLPSLGGITADARPRMGPHLVG